MGSDLRLRPLRREDEAAFLDACRVMEADRFGFALGYEDGMAWADYLDLLEARRCGQRMVDGWVPGTFLVGDVGGTIVGRASVRHRLNEWLAREGGHIGYGVLPEHRRRGHATEMLRQALVIARSYGVERVLVTCDDDNVGSAAVIERCGGVHESTIEAEDGTPLRRYWID